MSNSLAAVGIQLTRVIVPVTIIVGVVGNSLNIAALTRQSLYRHACSQYFLAVACNNLFYSSIFLINNLLSSGYQITISDYSTFLCKIINYISTISAFLSPYFIVLASLDRYCASSQSAYIRKFSYVRVAQWMIIGTTTVFSLLFINVLVMTNIQAQDLTCDLQANTLYSQVYIIIQVVLFAVVPPALMTVFGLMTIRNSHKSRVVRIVVSRFNRTEHQLARMLFLQVSIQILLTLPTSVTYLMSYLPNTIRTTSIFSFLSTIFQFLFDFSYVTPFFLYLLSGRIYRKELFRLIYAIFRIRCNNHIEPLANQNTVQPAKSSIRPQSAPSH